MLPHVETGVERETLTRIFDHLTAYPEGFTVHPKLGRQFQTRSTLFHEQATVEWATAELLAFGSLVLEGFPVRLAGEDSRRGTFSQRHATLIDYDTGKPWTPIGELPGANAKFWAYDSLLSEYAAVGLRVRLHDDEQGRARPVGGAVRRLRQRRAGHHRPVHRRRRGQVGHRRVDSCCCCPTASRARAPSTRAPASSGS